MSTVAAPKCALVQSATKACRPSQRRPAGKSRKAARHGVKAQAAQAIFDLAEEAADAVVTTVAETVDAASEVVTETVSTASDAAVEAYQSAASGGMAHLRLAGFVRVC